MPSRAAERWSHSWPTASCRPIPSPIRSCRLFASVVREDELVNTLKPLLIVAVLAGIGYGVYVRINGEQRRAAAWSGRWLGRLPQRATARPPGGTAPAASARPGVARTAGTRRRRRRAARVPRRRLPTTPRPSTATTALRCRRCRTVRRSAVRPADSRAVAPYANAPAGGPPPCDQTPPRPATNRHRPPRQCPAPCQATRANRPRTPMHLRATPAAAMPDD